MNLRFAHVQKSLSSAPVQSCCPQRALFQVYISYSMQKGQASSCKMYTRGEIFIEICRFLVKLQAFCRILTKPEASAIFFTDSGRKPDAQAEACFLHLCGASAPVPAWWGCRPPAKRRGQAPATWAWSPAGSRPYQKSRFVTALMTSISVNFETYSICADRAQMKKLVFYCSLLPIQ